MQIVDPDDVFPVDLTDAPPDAPDVELAVTELIAEHGRLDPKAFAAAIAADPERWRVVDDDQAEWVARRLAEARTSIANDQARLDEYRARLDRWFAGRIAGAARTAAFFEAHLMAYALGQRRLGRKSVPLPSARLSTRGSDEPKVKIDDADRLVAWAQAVRPDLVKVEPTVLVTTLRGAVTVIDCAECDGMGEVSEMGSDPDLTETTVQCGACLDGKRVVVIDEDGGAVDVPGVRLEVEAPTAAVST